MSLQAGLCSVTFRKLEWERVLELALQAGMRGIEWGGDVHVPAGDRARAQAVRSRSADLGIAVVSYGSYFEVGASPAGSFGEALATAESLGAPNIRVWAGKRGIASADISSADFARTAGELSSLARAGAELGIAVSLEFHRDTLTDTLDSTLRLLDAVGDPNLFTYWQPRYWVDSADRLGDALAELDALHPRLSHLHVFNWERDRERLPLRQGSEFWQPVLSRVGSWGDRERYALLEFVRDDDPKSFADDARALTEWLT